MRDEQTIKELNYRDLSDKEKQLLQLMKELDLTSVTLLKYVALIIPKSDFKTGAVVQLDDARPADTPSEPSSALMDPPELAC